MKARLFGKANTGIATLEILIAFAVLILTTSAVILLSFGNQSVAVDSAVNNEAIAKTSGMLEEARALAKSDFNSVNSFTTTEPSGPITFTKKLNVADLSPCEKEVESSVSWQAEFHPQTISFSTLLADLSGFRALGGDCAEGAPASAWNNPDTYASDTLAAGNPTAIDVLDKVAYVIGDTAPYLFIANTERAYHSQNNGLFVAYDNSFDLGAPANSIDVIKWTDTTGVVPTIRTIAFLAMNTPIEQLKVIDVTDIRNPFLLATHTLSACVAGINNQGWRLYAYKNRLYFLTRYTAGPELHVFDITLPTNPSEIGNSSCQGFELGDTAESLVVRDQTIDGVTERFLYLATDEADKELRVLNVTNPYLFTEVPAADQDLAGGQDGQSLYLLGNKLYVGRQSTPPGADLYIYDVSNPNNGLPLLGSADIGTSVNSIKVAGPLAFLGTPKSGKELQIWNIADPAHISLVATYGYSNLPSQGFDYEPDALYAVGQNSQSFKIIYNHP